MNELFTSLINFFAFNSKSVFFSLREKLAIVTMLLFIDYLLLGCVLNIHLLDHSFTFSIIIIVIIIITTTITVIKW